jgi:hypothetical protein
MILTRVLAWRDTSVIHYTVHEQPEPPADRLDRAEQLVFVRDGFTYSAAAFAPLWLVAKRQWLALGLYVITLIALILLLAVLDAEPQWFLVASFALHLLIGFEADGIQRWTLSRRGYTMIGSVSGRTQTDCERRFLESWLPTQPMLNPAPMAAVGQLAGMADGLIGAAGRSSGWLGALRRG